MDNEIDISFSQGTLLIDAKGDAIFPVMKYVKRDPRINSFRAKAIDYGPIVLTLHGLKVPYCDNAKDFSPISLVFQKNFIPRGHQQEALDAWVKAKGRGVVVMPTGSGKSLLGMMVLQHIKRPALIVVPTIDLMHQWASVIEEFLGVKVGMIGGGAKDLQLITVTTYDSAVIHMEFIGNKFGLVIFDECHHLPGKVNRTAALMCIAPYRLGLTATPEREEDEYLLYSLIGPLAYRIEISDLEGQVLAPYKTQRIQLSLDEDEAAEYQVNRAIYTTFLKENGIFFKKRSDWGRFVALCARLPGGKKVFKAYLTQKKIARAGRAKVRMVWELLRRHQGERILIFTADNDSAYELGEAFYLPVITHKTKVAERKLFLDNFRNGTYPVLVTSKVLNEGVDVPEASVGVVVSGSGSIREHVQRLGRILRAVNGKQAVLYELISGNTAEVYVSERRRKHSAYKRSY